MTERLKIEHLYKVFAARPERALDMLRCGATKADVLRDTGHVVGLDDVSLSVPAGAMYMIMGLSGSGKSTLARCVNRLNEPSAGRILLDDTDLCALAEPALRDVRRKRISMVFQHFALLPNRPVIENVEFGLKLRGVPAAARRQRAGQVLEVVGLARWADKLPHELSGGMRQRVGLARALATDADILIMDEAFSALDPLIRAEMQDELLRLQRTLNKTILFITHDFQEALKLGTRIAIMSEGRLVREGTPQSIVTEPGSDYVAAFTRDVDRARLFNAGASMTSLAPLVQRDGWTVLAGGEPGPAFVVDADARVLGLVGPAQIDALRDGLALPPLDAAFACVPAATRLVDAAAHFGTARAVGVIDEVGRLVGRLEAGRVLAHIGAGGANGAKHV
ncbi:quaternary amine ABC transporter ATP-binding protein [Paraburkholderia silvatlantica]|uniref:Glycine betaine/proline transport system ATP-binding protein n=1 Tax=Paraburkholderia silvatlantica TaxID=321895 RepID=A0ABR6FPC3_9BURK|nr:glycine betaine/L-proline ABC transporter ATP-binding protein [Paraburkholderia silvatlantica]MBB2929231.1 glycine betaine/proline transport system ATP-binding protein [Paraburkholderia silvatlantica]PVY27260.1 glycine betaine/proline transport system ATP-binding protein [Paraburkholderia silvatlantica]PXW34289.1 glycine betaine/proline transport system ATP-binding protein [Paraburkholderia silvatlantica]TDQ85184.1 glycine betaine/proline transport system ATP-binding protein [Paraburkholderi